LKNLKTSLGLYVHGRGWFDTAGTPCGVLEQMKEVQDALG